MSFSVPVEVVGFMVFLSLLSETRKDLPVGWVPANIISGQITIQLYVVVTVLGRAQELPGLGHAGRRRIGRSSRPKAGAGA